MKTKLFFLFLISLFYFPKTQACSIVYYVDSLSGKIYALNNEDYWYDVHPYVSIVPGEKGEQSRLWYGWDDFAQGGVNASGLFFDAAVTPDQPEVKGYTKAKNNLGDRILAQCRTVNEALLFLEKEKIAYTNGHFLFGDKTGNAVVVEWVEGDKKIINKSGNYLMATNFLLTAPEKGNYPCLRYEAMEAEIKRLKENKTTIGMKEAGNILAKSIQPKTTNEKGKEAGTLYSTFINLTDMEFVIMFQYDNSKMTKLDLKQEFSSGEKKKIKLK